jgi:tRNA threonylcarbamoyladenosine biosynthesis protein TsaB
MDLYYICLETATEVCSVAIGQGNDVIVTNEIARKNSHTETITLQIDQCMKEASLQYHQIKAIGISSGPGSYTGLRVGTSVAKGLCYALNIPLIAIETLKGLAAGLKADIDAGTVICPMIDARRMEVYAADYNTDLEELRPVYNLILGEGVLAESGYNHVMLCGNGAHKAKGIDLGVPFEIISTTCSASDLMKICNEHFLKGKIVDMAYFSPFYFKAPNVTKSKKNILNI